MEMEKKGDYMDNNIDKIPAEAQKTIALVAHDNKKAELFAWIEKNIDKLKQHKLCGTGTTSTLIREKFGLDIKSFRSGPVGGDVEISAEIVKGNIDILIFFWDPMEMQPHDPDVKALLRIAVLHDAIIAMNTATADFIFSSKLIHAPFTRKAIDTEGNLKKRVSSMSKIYDELKAKEEKENQ